MSETVPIFSRRVRYGASSTELVLVNAKGYERVRVLSGRAPREHVRVDQGVPDGQARLMPRETEE